MSDILIDRRSLEPPYEAPPDFVCPHCHAAWDWDEEENAWMCQTRPAYWDRSSEHPAIGGYCPRCFLRQASTELLHRYITESQLQAYLLEEYLNVNIYVLTEEMIALVDCLYEGYPEGYRDTAMAMIGDHRAALEDFADWCRGNGMEVREA